MKEKKQKSSAIWTLALLIAVLVFAFSLWQLSNILVGYHEVDKEYEELAQEMEQQTVPVPTQPQQEI